MSQSREVAVIGAGISGLCCAQRLVDHGFDVTLLESGSKAGGVIRSEPQQGFLLEMGPSSLAVKPPIRKLVKDLALEGNFLEVRLRDQPRFLYHGGALRPFPTGLAAFLTTPLLGWPSRLRLLGDFFRRNRPQGDLSVAEFFRRRFGQEVVDNFVAPFVSGIHAGNAETLSFQAAFPLVARFAAEKGSLLRGAIAWSRRKPMEGGKDGAGPSSLGSFRGGLGQLCEALAKRLWNRLHLGTTIEKISPPAVEGGMVEIVAKDRNGRPRSWKAGALVLAQPSHRAAETLASSHPALAGILGEFPYSPLVVVHLGLPLDSLKTLPRGFGFLVPRDQGLRILGCLWTSSVFEGRAPSGHALLSAFYAGALDPDMVKWTDAEILEQAKADLGKAMGWDGRKSLFRVTRLEKALPAYNLGHIDRVQRLKAKVETLEFPLAFVGNYLEGISVPDCVTQAWQTADSLAGRLRVSR